MVIAAVIRFLRAIVSTHKAGLQGFRGVTSDIVVFSRVRSLPVGAVGLFGRVIDFLSGVAGSAVLLYSTARPLLRGAGQRGLLLSRGPSLVTRARDCRSGLQHAEVITSTRGGDYSRLKRVVRKALANGRTVII